MTGSAGWVAGAVRARALAGRRAGADISRRAAAAEGLPEAVRTLSQTSYRRWLRQDMDLHGAERAIEQTLLWNLRVLAGWQPRPGVALLRTVVCRYEADNVLGRIRELSGEPAQEPYDLGGLAAAWSGVRRATVAHEVRTALAVSPWGDPGTVDPAALAGYLALSGAARLSILDPVAERWAAADAAVVVGRTLFLTGGRLGTTAGRIAVRLLGRAAVAATDWQAYVDLLPGAASWVLNGIRAPEELWRAEIACRLRKETDGFTLLRSHGLDAGPVLGAAVVLAADAWRVRAALECAARDARAAEVFDAVA